MEEQPPVTVLTVLLAVYRGDWVLWQAVNRGISDREED